MHCLWCLLQQPELTDTWYAYYYKALSVVCLTRLIKQNKTLFTTTKQKRASGND